MTIEKRKLPLYIFLNCITLGIYGAVVGNKIGKEVNALCKGDGEEPMLSYMGAVVIRAIPTFLGVIVGLIYGLINQSIPYFSWGIFESGQIRGIIVFSSILVFTIIFSFIGSIFSGIYLKYWWYKQASRLKLNAGRYSIEVRERGTDTFLFRSIINTILLPATIIFVALAILIPFVICSLILFLGKSLGATLFALILATIFTIIVCIFSAELTVGANFSMYFIFKNINRFSVIYKNGARQFDPMAYEYYPSAASCYPEYLPQIVNAEFVAPVETPLPIDIPPEEPPTGSVIGVQGTFAGYSVNLASGEKVVIGKDAKVSQIVIDTSFKEISRRHVTVEYVGSMDRYRVTDYSSNGTWADDNKLVRGEDAYLKRGTILKLANDKNMFRLG